MSQLSDHGHLTADPISIQSVRHALDPDSLHANVGIEGASNLFYYLFDDWRAVYSTISNFRHRLEELVCPKSSIRLLSKLTFVKQTEILDDMVGFNPIFQHSN